MKDEKIIIPLKEEVKTLLGVAKNNRLSQIGDVLGMKLLDLQLPKFDGEPNWNFNGLRKFFEEFGIATSDTIDEAIVKLNKR